MIKRIFKFLKHRNTPSWMILLIDLYIVANTFVLAYIIRFNFSLNFDTSFLVAQLPVIIFAALFSFLITGSYKGIIRHTGYRDSVNIGLASLLMAFALFIFTVFNRNVNASIQFSIPYSILAIHFLLNVLVLISSRFFLKELYQYLFSSVKAERKVLIYGAGETGLLTYSVLRDLKDNNIKIVGFIDDNKHKAGKKINGLYVYDSSVLTKQFIAGKNISDIVISIQNISVSRLMQLVDKLSLLELTVKIVPPAKTWIEGDLNPQQIKNVRIEDLLGRQAIDLNNPAVKENLNDKVVLITGAAGSIGSEIVRQVAGYTYKQLILIDQAESDLYDLEQELLLANKSNFVAIVADIRGQSRMLHIFEQYKPQVVYHAAAYKHVPLMEANPFEAINVNVLGTKIIVDLAIRYAVERFVFISTDKAVNPTNVMGASKRLAEMYINSVDTDTNTKFITTRFGNVLGSNGSVIPLFKKQLEQGGPLTVTHKDITRYFMTIPEACQLVLEAGAMGNGGELYVFDMGESVKIFDLALNMIHLSGLKYKEDIDIKITGLRPGEKIFEELLANDENTLPTHHKKIMIARVQAQHKSIKNRIEALCLLNKEMNFDKTVSEMKAIVPEYVSENSTFQSLDRNLSGN